ncbi:deoxyribodipyrimidine photo-lyase [candidate division KSB1 bacterium]|nr:deoxyribodipyrimidine photo-lyase [candidate division KSB1 bacterium]
MSNTSVCIFWFRRDLRLEDNTALHQALRSGHPVLPLFIFDSHILTGIVDNKDRRVEFIHLTLKELQQRLVQAGSSLLVRQGEPLEVWRELIAKFPIQAVYANRDYEPYAIDRDQHVSEFLKKAGVPFHTFKDHVIFERDEAVKEDGSPYTVYTPYKNKWLKTLQPNMLKPSPSESSLQSQYQCRPFSLLSLNEIGFEPVGNTFPDKALNETIVKNYHKQRDYPGVEGTTRLGLHIRFGTVSIRRLVRKALELNETWLSELIWREFFTSILHHFPHTADQPFKKAYAAVPWREDHNDFERWCSGTTGYPMVDAGMRQLNETGFMHNRVRMIAASFLCKHLLLPWQWGERYFAEKLLDYDMAANVGNWQWAAGCGCDAAPYFRVFNPELQQKKFDPERIYLKKWLPEIDTPDYPSPMIPHTAARIRALQAYKSALKK